MFGSVLLSKAEKCFDFEPFYKSHNEMSDTCYMVGEVKDPYPKYKSK